MRFGKWLLCVVTVSSAVSAGELALQAPLKPEKLVGCVLEDGALRLPDPLPTQTGRAPICVEAEAFRSVKWQEFQESAPDVIRAEDAGAGGCVALVHEAIYHVVVARAGYYHYWQRVWIPRRASWTHMVQVNDAMPTQLAFGLRKGDEAKKWFWIKGSRHYLRRGVHTVAIRNLHNGKRLDRWVLAPDADWTPEGVGPAASPVRSSDAGEFVSAPLDPLSLLAWTKLEAKVEGKAGLEVSYGDGAFQSLPDSGALAGTAKPLRARVTMQRGPDGKSPEVALGNVHYTADHHDFILLRNKHMQLLIHRATGRICGLRDTHSGRRYLPDGVPATLFQLETKAENAPETVRLSSDDAVLKRASARGRKARLDYELAGGEFLVTVTVKLGRDWMARFAIEVQNRSQRDVIGVVFPTLAQVRAGADSSDDMLCFPSMSGRLVKRPGEAGTLTSPHPIRTTIGFCDLYDEQGGVMLAPLDYPMVLTHFASTADPSRQSAALSLTRRDRVRPGQSATFTAGVGVHPGDWHTAADWYRNWFTEHVGKPRIPDWVRDSDGWITWPDAERMAGLGFNHIQMWMQTGFAGCPTYYLPNPKYHSEKWFTDLATAFRGLGGHLGVYYHGNGMSRSYILADKIYGIPVNEIPDYKRPPGWDWFVRNHAYGPERKPVEKLDMSAVPEPAKKEEYPNMCWQKGEWRDYLEKWGLDIYLKEYGLDTPYWDTFACRDVQDFNPHFGHNGEGRGAMARYRFLLDMQKKGEKHAPGFYQTVEGGSELLGLAAGQLQSNFVQNLEVGRYTHPEQIYYVGHSNGWWTPPKTHRAACMAFYLNTKMDIIRLTPKVAQVVRCRRWFAPWLYHSRFLDDVGLAVSHPKVKGALHVYRSRAGDALLVTFMNWQGITDVTATVEVSRYLNNRRRLEAFLVRQGELPSLLEPSAIADQGVWTFDVPAAPVSAVLFLERPDRATPVVQARQYEASQLVEVFDPARKQRNFRIHLDTHEATFRPDPDAGDGANDFRLSNTPDAEGGPTPVTYSRTIEYVEYANLKQLRHIDITLEDRPLKLAARSLATPLLIDPDFEREMFDPAEAHSGKRSLKIVPPNGLRHFPLELVPGHRYRISLWLKKLEKKGSVCANVHHHLSNEHHHFAHVATLGEWSRAETTFLMRKGKDQPHLYLYNWQGTTQPVWFDNVKVEDLGPPEPTLTPGQIKVTVHGRGTTNEHE